MSASRPGVWLAMRLGGRAMRRHPGLAGLFLATTVVEGALQGLMIWALRGILLRFGGSGPVSDTALVLAAAAILAVSLAQSASVYFGELTSVRLCCRVEVESMWEVLAKLLTLPVRYFDRNSQADVVMASYYDLKGIRNVTNEMGRLVLYVSRIVGLAVVAWVLSPKLAIVGLVAVPLGAVPAYFFGQRITRAADRERTAVTTLHDSFYQFIGGIRLIKVARGEKRILESAREIGNELQKQIVRQARDRGLSRLLLEAVSSIGLIVVILIGGRDVAAGTLGWLASACLVRDARLLISNDSAPVHLASAMGTPVVEIYGATVPAFGFTPFAVPHRIVGLEGLACRPCGIHGGDRCPIGTFECMERLPADRVISAAVELLAGA